MGRDMIRIETKRLRLRDFRPEDAADLHDIFGDEETMRNVEPVYDVEKTNAFLRSFCIEQQGALAAENKASGKLIGYILFKKIEDGVYEIGWIFNRQYWRQRYAYEACSAVVDYAFSKLSAHKIIAEATDGQKSVGLMEKLGMKREGVQRSHTKDNQGRWADLYLYGLLESNWVMRQSKLEL